MTNPEDAPIEPARANPMALIATLAQADNCDPAKLTALVELQERMLANEARAEWATAMAEFQARTPLIVKTQAADRYAFASHAYIMERIKPLLAECGLSLSFSSETTADGRIHLTCNIAHGTHVESREFTCPVPKVPGANDTQCMGAGLSYGMKYLLVSALNLSVGGMDCDGGPEPNPAPAADPNATTAPGREERSAAKQSEIDLWGRWEKAGGDADGWRALCKKASGLEKVTSPEDLDFAAWERAEVLVGEFEEASNG